MGVVVALVFGFVFFEAIGALIHRAMHSRWSGPLWRNHMRHHAAYPPRDVQSDAYRSIGPSSATWWYTGFGVLVAAVLVATTPLHYWLALSCEMLVVGWLNDRIHDATHVNGGWLERFGWFRSRRELHQLHHRHHRHNFGLLMFWVDRALGTYRGSGTGP